MNFRSMACRLQIQILLLQPLEVNCLPAPCDSEGAAMALPDPVAEVDQFAVARGEAVWITLAGMCLAAVAGHGERRVH